MRLFWPNFPVFRLQLAGATLKVPEKDFLGRGEKVNVDPMPVFSLGLSVTQCRSLSGQKPKTLSLGPAPEMRPV